MDDAEGNRRWLFEENLPTKMLFHTPEVRQLGFRWFDHPQLNEPRFEQGMERIYNGCDELFASLGYEHERYSGRYKAVAPNNDRVALFAHQGFGLAFGLMVWIGLYDTLFLDWVLFANHRMFRLEGTEHMDAAYHQKWFHLKGMLFPGIIFALIPAASIGPMITIPSGMFCRAMPPATVMASVVLPEPKPTPAAMPSGRLWIAMAVTNNSTLSSFWVCPGCSS